MSARPTPAGISSQESLFKQLDDIALQCGDNEAARHLHRARKNYFETLSDPENRWLEAFSARLLQAHVRIGKYCGSCVCYCSRSDGVSANLLSRTRCSAKGMESGLYGVVYF